ncbi:mitochondrial import inner membrane translocase subunit Tim22 [Planoprotostelium fungivorum]|uniref:Mitochondrial import inner membrane translocase subunit TIM22 n=1 Tax=Planoprotostelium fungivorum TaxID=1890364 RepID=A0A2P6N5Q3_9EUKA|nr:mitochondrial import inner membrane translocase subunit Tim22 [Planoprotostelium fungivorum]
MPPSPNGYEKPPPPVFSKFQEVFESCPVKTVASSIIGGAMGLAIGGVFGFNPAGGVEDRDKPLKEQLKIGFRQMKQNSTSMGRNFFWVGGIFTATECYFEWGRGKDDRMNSIYAGLLTGAILARNAGPKGIAFSAGGFAAFSAAIDWFMGRHDPSMHAHHDDIDQYKDFTRGEWMRKIGFSKSESH